MYKSDGQKLDSLELAGWVVEVDGIGESVNLRETRKGIAVRIEGCTTGTAGRRRWNYQKAAWKEAKGGRGRRRSTN